MHHLLWKTIWNNDTKWYNVTKAVLHCYSGVATGDVTWKNVIIRQSKNGAFMMSQSFLAVSDDVHIKNHVFTLKLWKHKMWLTKKMYIWKAICMQNIYVNDDGITLNNHSLRCYFCLAVWFGNSLFTFYIAHLK